MPCWSRKLDEATVSMPFATKAEGIQRPRLQPLMLAGIQGRRSQIKQNQGPLHINHTAVQLLSALYNLTISRSHCSSCAGDCAHVCVVLILTSFFFYDPSPLFGGSAPKRVRPVYALSYAGWLSRLPPSSLHRITPQACAESLRSCSLCVFIARLCCCSRTFSWLPFGQPLALMSDCRTECWARHGTSFHYSWHRRTPTDKRSQTNKQQQRKMQCSFL